MPRRPERSAPGSLSPTAGKLLTVGDLRDWHRLSVQCADVRCRHRALIDARWIRARRPAGETLAVTVTRCRCTACGRLGTSWWSGVAAPRDG